jgi:hypothetical protein
MNSFDHVGMYGAQLHVAYVRSRPLLWLVAAGWVVFPCAVASLLWPCDLMSLQHVLQGLGKLHSCWRWWCSGVGGVRALVLDELGGTAKAGTQLSRSWRPTAT